MFNKVFPKILPFMR